jgi:adenylate kinase family enzyme
MNFEDVKINDLRRTAVIGSSCSGKTTFARSLAELLEINHVELDAIHWLPEWTKRPVEEFRVLVQNEAAADAWIIEGGYSKVREIIWARATTVIWLDYSFPVVFSRALRRTMRRIFDREILYSNNRETFGKVFMSRDSILLWVLQSYKRKRRQFSALVQEPKYRDKQILIFRSPRETEEFLLQLQKEKQIRQI